MSKELDTSKDLGNSPDVHRRQLGVGLLAVLAGGLGLAQTAQAFSRRAAGDFAAASRILAPYGVTVTGDTSSGHDVLDLDITPLPATEYSETVRARNRLGGLDPCVKTSVFEDDASFTHFHPGEIVPCVRTTIEGHALATHELFDAADGDIVPCVKVASEMLKGGVLGAVEVTLDTDLKSFRLFVGGNTYNLVNGELVLEQR